MSRRVNILLFIFFFFVKAGIVFSQQTDSAKTTAPTPTVSSSQDTTKKNQGTVAANDTSKTASKDSTKKVERPKVNEFKVGTTFLKDVQIFNKGEIISNVLWVVNENTKPVVFTVLVSAPDDWQTIGNTKTYTVQPNGELYIPVRVMPRIGIQGSGNFLIWANMQDNEDRLISSSSFNANLFKVSNWNVSADKKKYYLKNDEYSTNINVNISNNGNFKQDLFVSAVNNRKDVTLTDSLTGKPLKSKNITLSPGKDTSISVNFTKLINLRNQRFLDIDNYSLIHTGESNKSNILWKAESPYPNDRNTGTSNYTTDIIKLGDEYNFSPSHSAYLPLIMNLNVYNIIGGQPIMNLALNGNAQLDEKQYVYYNFQSYFTNNYLSFSSKSLSWFAGYSNRKFMVQVGNGGGYIFGAYTGSFSVKGEYFLSPRRKIGIIYTQMPTIGYKPTQHTEGLYYRENGKKYSINANYAHSTKTTTGTYVDLLNVSAQFKFIKNHTFGVKAFGSRKFILPDTVKWGYGGGLNYNGRFGKKFSVSDNFLYINRDFGVFNSSRLLNNAIFNYKINKKYSLFLASNFIKYQYPSLSYYNEQFGNDLRLQINTKKFGVVSPDFFYNYYNIGQFSIHSRGLGIGYSRYNMEKNLRTFFNLRMGYNYSPDTLRKNFFFAMFASQLYYKTLNVTFRYLVGNLSVSENIYLLNRVITPQMLNVSARHQYQFKVKNFVMDNMLSFVYSNYTSKSIFWQPTLYFYNKGGWRVMVSAQINFTKTGTNIFNYLGTYYPINGGSDNSSWQNNILLNAGVRKEFHIPIPFKKKMYSVVDISAFYDLNGDGKKQDGEQALENVVVQIDENEAQTNSRGMITFKNLAVGAHTWSAFALEDINEWYPNIPDTLNILSAHESVMVPFTHGVKILGKVFLHKDPKAVDGYMKMDLSRIKITASNHKVYNTLTDLNGSFQLFLPAGKYTITMDETVLGNRYKLLKNNFEIQVDDKFANIFIPYEIVQIPKKVKTVKFDEKGNPINDK